MRPRERRAGSLAEFLAVCAELVESWSTPESGEANLWFRGQERADWGLVPGEYRYVFLNPDEMRSEFILKARPYVHYEPKSDWEWYFIMQHHGLPTRLLDWTAGSLTGLHFALRTNLGEHDAAVWVLDPWALNEWSLKNPDLVITGIDFHVDPVASKYLSPVYKKARLPRRPIAIVPPYNSPRITAQRGAFTVHGSNQDGIETQFRSRLSKIVIAKDRAFEMKRELRGMGISESALFPDLDGLCRDIRSHHVEGA